MKRLLSIALPAALVLAVAGTVIAEQKGESAGKTEKVRGLLPTDRIVVGTVEDIQGDQIKVNLGELQPRFLSLGMAKEKGFPPIKKGDKLVVVLNDLNLLVDYHPFGKGGQHHVVRGSLVTPLVIGHDRAVIRTTDGREESFEIRPLAQSRVAAIPVGSPALFLVDETNKITDAFFGSEEALARSEREYRVSKWQGSSLKGAHTRLPATLVKGPKDGHVMVRTEAGKEETYQIRPIAQDKLSVVREGDKVILLIDEEHKVVDVAVPKG
jgi:hypothetical protein